MKKFILLIILFIDINGLHGQTMSDTLAMLQNIANKKTEFIGKPFSVLLDSLKYNIVYFSPNGGLSYDMRKETDTRFYFINPESLDEFQSAYIDVAWEPYLDHIAATAIYQNTDGWTQQAAQFYSNGIIKNMVVSAKIVTTTTLPPPVPGHWIVTSCKYKKVFINGLQQWAYEIIKKYCDNGNLGTVEDKSYSTTSVAVQSCTPPGLD